MTRRQRHQLRVAGLLYGESVVGMLSFPMVPQITTLAAFAIGIAVGVILMVVLAWADAPE